MTKGELDELRVLSRTIEQHRGGSLFGILDRLPPPPMAGADVGAPETGGSVEVAGEVLLQPIGCTCLDESLGSLAVAIVRNVEYQADGVVMRGRMAVPESEGPFPGVLIAHEANGLDDYQAGRATTLAELGIAAFALDYHGNGKVFTDSEEMSARLGDLGSDVELIRTLARAGFNVLLAEPKVDPSRVAAIGYCFGETVMMELARTGADLRAVVGFHPGLNILRPGDSQRIRGSVLMCVGADDPITPPERRIAFEEEMRSSGVDWRINLYGGAVHSFTHPRSATMGTPGLKYDQRAAQRSWRAMLDLFNEVL
jgi:dienelactone hydrolase